MQISRVPEPEAADAAPESKALLSHAAALFSAYRETLLAFDVPIDLFQGFAQEIAALPGPYVARARGCILVAQLGGACVGCVALKDLGGGVGEVKRLFVLPAARRRGVAEALCGAVEAAARDLGYSSLVLDTLVRLPGALQLYAKLGYALCDAYNDNPLGDVRFLRKALSPPGEGGAIGGGGGGGGGARAAASPGGAIGGGGGDS